MSDWRIHKEHGINFAEAGSGPLIVLCHGGAGSHTHWTRNIDALAEHFTVRALDLPGYGESDPTNKSYTARQYVDAAVPKVDALTSDVDRFHLVGFSFGGALSAGISAALGKRVAKLTMVAPGGFGDPVGRKLDMRRLPEGNLDVPEVRVTSRRGEEDAECESSIRCEGDDERGHEEDAHNGEHIWEPLQSTLSV